MKTGSPSPHALENEYPITEKQTELYQRKGHILLRGVATPDEISAHLPSIEGALQEILSRQDSQGRIEEYSALFQQVTNVWRMSETAKRFVFARRFAKIAADLMGVDGVRLYHDQALYKPPGGRGTPWHQDQFYWPLDTRHTITMWMPLLDLTREMGTMMFAGSSHREGQLVSGSLSEESHRRFEEIISERGYPVESHDLAAGDATFHAGWSVHATHPNRSRLVRKVITVIYYADGTRLLEPDTDFRKVDMVVFHPGQKPGDVAASPLNPLLYERP
ncbi:MAG: phytanoyl-CoA dioxygenase family protein [Bacteroidota bacterium]